METSASGTLVTGPHHSSRTIHTVSIVFMEKKNCIICAVQSRYFVVVAFQNISITLVLES